MKKLWVPLVSALAGLLVLAACALENQASDRGIAPQSEYGTGTTAGAVRTMPVSAHSCCETWPARYTNDGSAAWAVDGILTHWWHSNYTNGHDSYSLDTGAAGHVGDWAHYLMRGDSGHLDGYTWTEDRGKAVDGPEYPVAVQDIVPAYGSHWITVDLGETVEISAGNVARLGYYPRGANAVGGLGRAGFSYELYVSEKDFGWLVDGVTLLDSGTVANTAGYKYITVEADRSIKFRYYQLRWIYDSTVASSGDNKSASAANLLLKIFNSGELDYSYLTSVYIRGLELLKTLPVDGRNYYNLKTELVKVQNLLVPPDNPTAVDTLEKRLNLQDSMDAASDSLLTLLYKINPPPKPPEVFL